jgi:hypothetical protein
VAQLAEPERASHSAAPLRIRWAGVQPVKGWEDCKADKRVRGGSVSDRWSAARYADPELREAHGMANRAADRVFNAKRQTRRRLRLCGAAQSQYACRHSDLCLFIELSTWLCRPLDWNPLVPRESGCPSITSDNLRTKRRLR